MSDPEPEPDLNPEPDPDCSPEPDPDTVVHTNKKNSNSNYRHLILNHWSLLE